MYRTLNRFRHIAMAEGVSLLVLLLIAMPLKYLAGIPQVVRYVGWLHGILFVLYGVYLIKVWIEYKWSFLKAALAFLASFIPFGTFIMDRRLKKEQQLTAAK
ncbi:MAG: rane protein [Ferruginibacter sp.]|nr:rane protein [Ferruginibacter sp.]